MTKSGIGTMAGSGGSVANAPPPPQPPPVQPPPPPAAAQAEIPIWIADKKKWVTGISKKTTINDLIYAILKQCQMVQAASSSSTDPNYQQQYAQIVAQFVLAEYMFDTSPSSSAAVANATALSPDVPPLTYPTPQANMVLVSQRLLAGDSKVYKYLSKWSQYPLAGNGNNNGNSTGNCSNLILKILQRHSAADSSAAGLLTTATSGSVANGGNGGLNAAANSEAVAADGGQQHQHSSTSLATKLLKKFGVSSSSNNTGASATTAHGTSKSSSSSHLASTQPSFKFVDVKLPQPAAPLSVATTTSSGNAAGSKTPTNNGNAHYNNPHHQQQHSAPPRPHQHNVSPVSSSSLSNTNSSSSINGGAVAGVASQQLNLRNPNNHYDPNVQKSFLFNTIVEKDNKLKQQIERFQLLDELIKETEKKSKYAAFTPSSNYNNNNNNATEQANQHGGDPTAAATTTTTPVNVVDLNDIYCHFPEMCTHHLREVEDFTKMCSQLFQLDEAINKQKSMLSNLEADLQRELNPNLSVTPGAGAGNTGQPVNETPETLELRKEVNLSREQTRVQCKQLHDLDLRMRQNEQSLACKEQQLQQLLEELYFHEIYNETTNNNSNKQPMMMMHSPSAAAVHNFNNSSCNQLTVTNNESQHNASIVNMEQAGVGGGNTNESTFFGGDDSNESKQTNSNENEQSDLNVFNISNSRPVELAIRNESAANYLNNFNNRRQVRMFGDSNDDMFVTSAAGQRQGQSQPPSSQSQLAQFSISQQRSSSSNSSAAAVKAAAAASQLQHQAFNGSTGNLNQSQRSLSYSNLASNNPAAPVPQQQTTNSHHLTNGGYQAQQQQHQIPLQVQQAQPVMAINTKMKNSVSNGYVSAGVNGIDGMSKTASFDVNHHGSCMPQSAQQHQVNHFANGGGNHGYATNPKTLKLNSNLNINQLGGPGQGLNAERQIVVTSGVVDQSGDNDSGISSMSSETTAAIIHATTTTTTSSTFHHQNYLPPPANKHGGGAAMSQPPMQVTQSINNQYNNNNNNIHQQPQQHRQPVYLNGASQYQSSNNNINSNAAAAYHHQYHMPYMSHQPVANGQPMSQQHHLQHQQQQVIQAITPNGTKSMLETLV